MADGPGVAAAGTDRRRDLVTPQRYQQVKEVFAQACALPAEQRAAYLARACAGDDGLRSEVEALLAHDEGTFPIEPPINAAAALGIAADAAARASDSAAASAALGSIAGIPRQIGHYRIIRQIGQGGMGAVFEAEQENPKRTIALKIIRPDVTSEHLLRRFRFEAQALGRLQHPGIAQIYDAGVAEVHTEGGLTLQQPFFAMEYIRGTVIDRYATARDLDVNARLSLLAEVCDAVQHAHQKGVIHRDLKPGNILVDDAGRAKILDFGVARATDADVQATTLHTAAGQLIGTLPYMSPEQVAGDPQQLDTRSDVYALGVLCFQLLAGRLPHELERKTIPEAVRTIADNEPTQLGAVNRDFRGDLQTIVAKALEKDKTRRYQSAADLAADIRRFLADQPIAARPATTFYQLRKFARRNRVFVGAVLAVFLALVAGIVSTSVQAVRATRAQGLAEAQRAEAITQAAKADAIRRFLEDMLASLDPATARDRDTAVLRELLDHAAGRVQAEFDQQPLVRASLHATIGRTYRAIGRYAEAEQHARQALELRRAAAAGASNELAGALIDLAAVLVDTNGLDEAATCLEEAWQQQHQEHPPDNADLARILDLQAHVAKARGELVGAEQLLGRAADILAALPAPDDPLVFRNARALGVILAEQGKYAEAEQPFRRDLEHQQRTQLTPHPEIASAHLNLGVVLKDQAKFDEAAVHLRAAVDQRRALFGKHKSLGAALAQLGALYKATGAFADAQAALFESLEIARATLPAEHPDLRQRMTSLGDLYLFQRKYDQAEELLREALAAERAYGGENRRVYSDVLHRLGHLLRLKAEFDESTELLREALAVRREIFAGPHPAVASTLSELGNVLLDRGDYDAAEPYLVEVLEMTRAAVGDTHPAVAGCMNSLATLHDRRGQLDAAEPLLREALAIGKRLFGERHVSVMVSINNLAGVIRRRGRLDEAEAMYREALALSRELLGAENTEAATILANLGTVCQSRQRLAEAEACFRESYTLEHKLRGADHIETAYTQVKLAGVLRASERAAEAYPLLIEAREILRARLAPTHVYIQVTLMELGRAALALGQPDDAEPALRECLALRRQVLKPGDVDIAHTERALAEALVALERFDEAEQVLLKSHADLAAALGPDDAPTRRAAQELADFYDARGRPERARTYRPADAAGSSSAGNNAE